MGRVSRDPLCRGRGWTQHTGAFTLMGTWVTRRGESGAREHGGEGEWGSQGLWGGRKEGVERGGERASPRGFWGKRKAGRLSGAGPSLQSLLLVSWSGSSSVRGLPPTYSQSPPPSEPAGSSPSPPSPGLGRASLRAHSIPRTMPLSPLEAATPSSPALGPSPLSAPDQISFSRKDLQTLEHGAERDKGSLHQRALNSKE